MSKAVPAIILAAGASTRLGQPKALVKWQDETLIHRAVRMLKSSNCLNHHCYQSRITGRFNAGVRGCHDRCESDS